MLAAFAILAIVSLVGRRAIASPALGRVRALFPAWRLFDRAVASPALFVRFAIGSSALGPWSAVRPRRRGRAVRWLFAPDDNLALAYQAAVDQLASELGDLDESGEPGELVSYELVARIAAAGIPAGARFQWKLVVVGDRGPEDYLVSRELAA